MMQGQKTSVESLPETFDHGSASRNLGNEQPAYWNNMLLDPMETQSFPDYLRRPADTSRPYASVVAQQNSSFDVWNSGGPSTSGHTQNHRSHDETKVDHGWASSLTINGGGASRIEERRHEEASMLSLGNININLNSYDVSQSSSNNAGYVGMSRQLPGGGLTPHSYNHLTFQPEHIASSSTAANRCGNSSGNVGIFSEDVDGGQGSSFDGRRLSCKRKNIEGASGQSSASGSAVSFHQSENTSLHPVSACHSAAASMDISHSSDYQSGLNPPEEQMNPSFSTVLGGASSDYHPSVNIEGNLQSSHRNYRTRINPAHQHDTAPPSPWGPVISSGHSTDWSYHLQYPPLVPFNQPIESQPLVASSSSYTQSHLDIVPVQHIPWVGAFGLRMRNSLSTPVIAGENMTVSREEMNSRSMQMNNISEHAAYVPATDARQLVHDPRTWSLGNENISISRNAIPPVGPGTSSVFHPSVGTTWVQHPSSPTRHHQRQSEVLRQSFLPSGSSEFGGQSSNFQLQNSSHASTLNEMGHQRRTGFRGRRLLMMSEAQMDRQNDGVHGVPLSLRNLVAAREGRRRMLSEQIRNALHLMRRGENLRLEDVFMFDRAVLYGAADLHDRHRDMRLDVDNMSYEELLALEEQIGNVNTGLSEETIMKCLKQRKYLYLVEEASAEVEPCCICREEYADGEEVGTLHCGHEFHSACIKQWLTHKNLCPICKETALLT